MILLQYAVVSEELVERRIVDTFGVKLLVYPGIKPDCSYSLDISRPRAEGEAIQRVYDLLVGRELAVVESCLR